MSFPIGLGFWKQQSGDCSSYSPGLYTDQELNDMIFANGWIPVASAVELDKIRTGLLEDMGVGTCWQGKYTTGENKKYVQVTNIDGTGFGLFSGLIPNGMIYDGNELLLTNINTTDDTNAGIFASCTASEIINMRVTSCTAESTGSGFNASSVICGVLVNTTLKNITATLCTLTDNNSNNITHAQGIIFGGIASNSTTTLVENCHVINCTIISNSISQNVGSISNSVGIGLFYGADISGITNVVRNCTVDALSSMTFEMSNAGGFCGRSNCTIENCTTAANAIGTTSGAIRTNYVGGFVGSIGVAEIRRCKATGNVKGRFGVGSFFGLSITAGTLIEECSSFGDSEATSNGVGGFGGTFRAGSTIENCFSRGDATQSSTDTLAGTFIGELRNAGGTPSILYCYASGAADSNGTSRGFIGSIIGSAIVTDSYWDTDTSGTTISAAGTGKTTAELQTPTTNSGIYSTWTIPPWDFGANNEYPTLTTTP